MFNATINHRHLQEIAQLNELKMYSQLIDKGIAPIN